MEMNRATTLANVLARDRALDARDRKDTAIEKGDSRKFIRVQRTSEKRWEFFVPLMPYNCDAMKNLVFALLIASFACGKARRFWPD